MKSRKTHCIRLAVLAATTLVVAACGGGGSGDDGGYSPPPPPANTAPAISAISDKAVDQDTQVAFDFTVDDRESGAGNLVLSVTADGNTVIPADGMVLSGSGATRTLTLTPFEAATGTTSVSIRAADPEGAVTTRTFAVTVNAKPNSIVSMTFDAFAKADTDTALVLNGWSVDPETAADAFAGLIPPEE